MRIHGFLFWHPRCLHLIASLFAAVGNVARLNRYHNADVMWQEDAICARSKTNTASVSQHDPINAVCKKRLARTHAHTHTRADADTHTGKETYSRRGASGWTASTERQKCTLTANSWARSTGVFRVRHHRVSHWLFSPSSHIWAWARESKRAEERGSWKRMKREGPSSFFL